MPSNIAIALEYRNDNTIDRNFAKAGNQAKK